jgi:mono/diheme cytochrome c family protein
MLSSLFSPTTARPRILLGSALAALALAVPISGLTAESSAAAPPAPAGEVQFMRDIAPIFAQHCFSCHGPKEAERDLRLDIYESMTQGEHHAVVPGEPEHSQLVARITDEDSSNRMPRDDVLTPAQIDKIIRWVKAGAKFDGPDPKKPYATAPATPPASAPHPVHPPAAPSEREQKDRSKAGAPARPDDKA